MLLFKEVYIYVYVCEEKTSSRLKRGGVGDRPWTPAQNEHYANWAHQLIFTGYGGINFFTSEIMKNCTLFNSPVQM